MKTMTTCLSALAAVYVAHAASAQAESVGACAWARLPIGEHTTFLAAYDQGMQSGMAVLSTFDPEVKAAVASCAKRSNLPALWAQGAVASKAIQDGAASEVSRFGITRAKLDAAWEQAPEASRDCWRANASKVFAITGKVCSDPKAAVWFVPHLGLSLDPAHREAVIQVLYFMNTKAQSEYAEALIAKAP